MTHPSLFATFRVAHLRFGVMVEQVQEVLRFQEMTGVPLAPSVIGGLINLRGQIVTAVDLRRRRGLPDRADGAKPMNVILRTPYGPVSLLVDRIGDVMKLDDENFELPPATASAETRSLVRGVYKEPDGLVHVLNVEHVLDVPAADTGRNGSRSWRPVA
jgi:purine-binding chemotaxis protein CheW